jgi:hypothetical protein
MIELQWLHSHQTYPGIYYMPPGVEFSLRDHPRNHAQSRDANRQKHPSDLSPRSENCNNSLLALAAGTYFKFLLQCRVQTVRENIYSLESSFKFISSVICTLIQFWTLRIRHICILGLSARCARAQSQDFWKPWARAQHWLSARAHLRSKCVYLTKFDEIQLKLRENSTENLKVPQYSLK